MQLGIEYIYRGYGDLLSFHHRIGRAMDELYEAEQLLREAGREEYANELRDEHLPAGAIGDDWTYALVEAFQTGFLAAVEGFEAEIRDDLADGRHHITERQQQREWRERAEGWTPDE